MPIRWGIIGCGDVTEVKSGPAFQSVDGSELIAVMRRNGALAQDYAARHGVPYWYDDADALINNREVDAVYIATPPGSHLQYALKVCAAGKPAYVEKPMARNHAECERMVRAYDEAGLPLFVAYYRRALDRFVKARDLVSSGAIGKVTGVNYRFSTPVSPALNRQELPWPLTVPPSESAALPWRLQAEESGGGLFLDLGCHTLDIIAFMVGELQFVSGLAANLAGAYAVEDTVALCFAIKSGSGSGAIGSAHWNFAGGIREDMIDITGTDGRVSLSTFGNEPVRLETNVGVQLFDLPNPNPIQAPMIQSVVDALSGRGTCASTGKSASRTSQVIDAALRDYYNGREDSFWNRPDTWQPGCG